MYNGGGKSKWSPADGTCWWVKTRKGQKEDQITDRRKDGGWKWRRWIVLRRLYPLQRKAVLGAVIFLDSLLNFHTKNESILDMTFSG